MDNVQFRELTATYTSILSDIFSNYVSHDFVNESRDFVALCHVTL